MDKGLIEDLGLDLKPGDDHYRAYIGPPRDYDLISAMSFNLLTCLGLRQHHSVLDIGCGSLRVGRLLIPYLNQMKYFGIEPNKWLVEKGIDLELGRDLIDLKKPQFSFHSDSRELKKDQVFDFALAQSIFSHCGLDLIEKWLVGVAEHLSSAGLFLATFLEDQRDYRGDGWIYPGCVGYRAATIDTLARRVGLNAQRLSWDHPRQEWYCFYGEEADVHLFSQGEVNWNKFMGMSST